MYIYFLKKDYKKKRASKDIPVILFINKDARDYYQYREEPYELNKVYSAKLQPESLSEEAYHDLCIHDDENLTAYIPSMVSILLKKYYTGHGNMAWAADISCTENRPLFDTYCGDDTSIALAFIPRGSTYVKDEAGRIAATRLRITAKMRLADFVLRQMDINDWAGTEHYWSATNKKELKKYTH